MRIELNFKKFIDKYLEYYESFYWDELELDLKYQGFYETDYDSKTLFGILIHLEEEKRNGKIRPNN